MSPVLQLAKGRADRPIATTAEVDAFLDEDQPAVVAIGVSGGKDSCAAALATIAYLDASFHKGPRVLVHADLGRVEWSDSMCTCERLAAATGCELIVVRRKAGDMMDRWHARWRNNVKRYVELSCVKVILPWSTPSMRFCTSELKTAVITAELRRRYPGRTILNVAGIRRDESAKRRKAPVVKVEKRLSAASKGTRGYNWHPILDWSTGDVLAYLRRAGFALHEAYTDFGMTRVSCAYCIMGSADDLVASTTCPENHDIYREMVELEIRSTFAFQGACWLGDVAPHLLTEEQRARLADAKRRAVMREEAEALIPDHLLYTKGWPTVMPTYEEAVVLCGVRVVVALALGLDVECTKPQALLARYRALMDEKAAQDAARN